MKRRLVTFLTAGAVSMAALGGIGAYASDSGGGDRAELQAFLAAPQDIAAAIKAAEAASGGVAVAAEFDEKRGAGVYEVDTVARGRVISVKVDAATGAVIGTEDEGDLASADEDDRVDPAMLGAPLAQLVTLAEKGGEGRVMSIGLDGGRHRDGTVEVELANADGAREYRMAADGALTPDHGDEDDD